MHWHLKLGLQGGQNQNQILASSDASNLYSLSCLLLGHHVLILKKGNSNLEQHDFQFNRTVGLAFSGKRATEQHFQVSKCLSLSFH